MIHLIYGNEPYKKEVIKNSLRKQIDNPVNIVKGSAFDSDILEFLSAVSLFGGKKLVFLDIPTLSGVESKEFRSYLNNPIPETEVLILLDDYDKRTKLAKEFEKLGIVTECNKYQSKDELVSILLRVVGSKGGKITHDALDEFLERENYFESEVNLMGLINDLKTLLAISDEVTKPLVQQYVRMNEVSKVFELAKLIKAKNVNALYSQVKLVEPIPTISLLMREYRIAWKAALGIPYKGMYCFKELSREKAFEGLSVCQSVIDGIKSGLYSSDTALTICVSKLLAI